MQDVGGENLEVREVDDMCGACMRLLLVAHTVVDE